MAALRSQLNLSLTPEEHNLFERIAVEVTGDDNSKNKPNKVKALRLLMQFYKENKELFFNQFSSKGA